MAGEATQSRIDFVARDDDLNQLGQIYARTIWLLNNARLRRLGVVISVLLGLMLLVGFGGSIWGATKVVEIRNLWRAFDYGSASQQSTLKEILDEAGFVGFGSHMRHLATNPEDAGAQRDVRASLIRLRGLVTAFRSAGETALERAALDTLVQTVASYEEALEKFRIAGEMPPVQRYQLLAVDDRPAIAAINQLHESLKQEFTEGGHRIDAVLGQMSVTLISILLVNSVLLLLLAIFFQWFTRVRIVRALNALGAVMNRLVGGDHQAEVPLLDKADEVGDMARAVQVFKDNTIRLDQIMEDSQHGKERAEATSREIRALADRFEQDVEHFVSSVAHAAEDLQQVARSMADTADTAVVRTSAVAEASEQATGNAGAVATAAEELAASIGEISRQVNHSAEIAEEAMQEANHATSVMSELAETSEKIGDIVELIDSIAGQINLLALNATIESARAGAAGKGFAVVAGEVKNLSGQTAKATAEIAEQVSAIKAVSADAVAIIGRVSEIIGRINEYSSGVSAAVTQQESTTGEITRNIEQVASQNRTVSGSLSEVEHFSRGTGDSAKQVLSAAQRLGEESRRLSQQVNGFVSRVKAL